MGPLCFVPFLRPMVWGGRRLGDTLGKMLPDNNLYGESWEVSDHPLHASIVASGALAGKSLRDIFLSRRRELLGDAADSHVVFPWLIKHLDAQDWLSVQVHPDDEAVKHWWPGEGGKTEAWFVLEALPGSKIYAGLKPGVDERALRRSLETGNVAECLHSFVPRPGDCVFLPAGTVHAVGGGVLLAELQQTSDATFRLFDWNRRDAQGQSRPLHLEQSLACINWRQGPVMPVAASAQPAVRQPLVECRYFRLEFCRATEPFPLGGQGKLQVLFVARGHGFLNEEPLARGQAWLLPAAMAPVICRPNGSLSCLVGTLPA
jgi:mannose-6-phosphate isomerase